LGKNLKLFFATDIHGSDKCWMKFINSANFYGVKVLVLGGDLTAKGLVALVRQPDGAYTTSFRGKEFRVKEGSELEDLEKRIRWTGLYTYRATPEEVKELDSEEHRTKLINHLGEESLKRWMSIADQRLRGTDIKLFLTGGNDDEFGIDAILKKTDSVIYSEGQVLSIDESHEMISTGYGNVTPWHCPRDIPEEELGQKIDDMATKVQNIQNCIFNIHVPPYDSRLDDAPELDEKLQIKYAGTKLVPVGSTAVRRNIEKYQPLLGLHGHIHESKGHCKIGRTVCLNPGSTYTDGVLQGLVVEIDSKGVKTFTPTSG
jgi:Icc-related predicted phosphoesterase